MMENALLWPPPRPERLQRPSGPFLAETAAAVDQVATTSDGSHTIRSSFTSTRPKRPQLWLPQASTSPFTCVFSSL